MAKITLLLGIIFFRIILTSAGNRQIAAFNIYNNELQNTIKIINKNLLYLVFVHKVRYHRYAHTENKHLQK